MNGFNQLKELVDHGCAVCFHDYVRISPGRFSFPHQVWNGETHSGS